MAAVIMAVDDDDPSTITMYALHLELSQHA